MMNHVINENGGKGVVLDLSWIYFCGVVFWLLLEFPITGGPVSVATGDVFIDISVVYL